jgi:hypothetical protein
MSSTDGNLPRVLVVVQQFRQWGGVRPRGPRRGPITPLHDLKRLPAPTGQQYSIQMASAQQVAEEKAQGAILPNSRDREARYPAGCAVVADSSGGSNHALEHMQNSCGFPL